MIDALGIEREYWSPYCKEAHKDETGIYALVHQADHTPDCWRYRSGAPDHITIEAKSYEFVYMDDFRAFVRKSPAPRQVRHDPQYYPSAISDPSIWSQIIGTLILVGPVALIAWLVMQ